MWCKSEGGVRLARDREVPTLLLETIDDIDIFQAYGYALLIGLLGEEYIRDKNKKGE